MSFERWLGSTTTPRGTGTRTCWRPRPPDDASGRGFPATGLRPRGFDTVRDMDRPQQRYAALVEAGLALSSEIELPAVLQRIVELAVQITEARYGARGVLGPDGPRH